MPMTMKREMIWSTILGLVAVLGSYGFACVFPFAAVAALAAVTLDPRRGAAVVGATFLANQIVGFTLLSFPHDAQAYAWGGFIAAGAFAAFGAAILVQRAATFVSLRTVASLAAAIAAYQAAMFIGAVALDGFASSTPEIVITVALNDLRWFAGLGATYLLLSGGLQRLFSATPAKA
jgi:hypothetical protein